MSSLENATNNKEKTNISAPNKDSENYQLVFLAMKQDFDSLFILKQE